MIFLDTVTDFTESVSILMLSIDPSFSLNSAYLGDSPQHNSLIPPTNAACSKSLSQGNLQLDSLSSNQQAVAGGYTVGGPTSLHDGFSQVQVEVTLSTPVLLFPSHCLNPQILLTRNHALSCTPAFPILAGPCLHQSSTTARASLSPRSSQGVGHQWATRAERAAQWEQVGTRVRYATPPRPRPSNHTLRRSSLLHLPPSPSSPQPPEDPLSLAMGGRHPD